MSSASRDINRMREMAERHPNRARAIGAMILLHDRVDTPRQAQWVCRIGCASRPGDSHAEHQALAVMDLMARRGWLR